MKKFLIFTLTVVMLFTFGTIMAFATETAEETTNVAKIGDVEYSTFEEALAEANATSSNSPYIVLLQDITLNETMNVTGSGGHVVLDLNGFNVVSNQETAIEVTGNFGIINQGANDGSIVTTAESGTVINVQSTGMVSIFKTGADIIVGNGTGTALNSAGMFCVITGGTYLGKVSIVVSMFTNVTGGTYSEDPSAFMKSGYVTEKNSEGLYAIEQQVTESQIFTYKGYSVNSESAGVVVTYTINHDKLDAYERQNDVTVDFGAVFAIEAIDENAVEYSLSSYADTTTYNIKINEISEDNYTTALIMTMYVDFGEGKQYITGDDSNATVFVDATSVVAITYNQANQATSTEEEE